MIWGIMGMANGKRGLAGDAACAVHNEEVADLRHEGRDLKEVAAEWTLESRLIRNSPIMHSLAMAVFIVDKLRQV